MRPPVPLPTGPAPRGRPFATAAPPAVALLLAAALGSAAPAAAQQQPPAPSRQQQPAEPQQQQRSPDGGGGGGGGEPVEIVADSLTVEQERQLATFTGNVDAVQGDLRLRADKLLVHYDQGGEGEGRRPQAQGQAAQGGDQSIRRIEAVGNVFVTQPGETAKGDRGTYEPGSGAMTLEGNVVLTREQNVIRGARLESNQRTGVSTVFAAAPGAARKPDQRVRALFVRGGTAAAGGGAPAPAPTPVPAPAPGRTAP